MDQLSLHTSDDSSQCYRVRRTLANIKNVVASANAENRKLRRVAYFQAFVLALMLAGLVSLADWRVTLACYGIALAYLPFFAKR